MQESEPSIADYEETIGVRRVMLRQASGAEPGDPRKVGDALVMLSRLADPPLHLLLGGDVLKATREKWADFEASLEEWESTTLDVGFSED